MGLKDEILARLDYLIAAGEKVLATREPPPPNFISDDFVDTSLFQQWQTSSLAFLKSKLGENSVHAREYEEKVNYDRSTDTVRGMAILKAAREDVAGGYLNTIENLVSADLFSDFLEMAAYLLGESYKDPAASLTGAVLEEGLRRLSVLNNIPVKPKENISSLSQKLADRGIYNRLRQKQIAVWEEIRNNADHGYFDRYSQTDVEEMIKGVRSFFADTL